MFKKLTRGEVRRLKAEIAARRAAIDDAPKRFYGVVVFPEGTLADGSVESYCAAVGYRWDGDKARMRQEGEEVPMVDWVHASTPDTALKKLHARITRRAKVHCNRLVRVLASEGDATP